jgi:hypothetical protein
MSLVVELNNHNIIWQNPRKWRTQSYGSKADIGYDCQVAVDCKSHVKTHLPIGYLGVDFIFSSKELKRKEFKPKL